MNLNINTLKTGDLIVREKGPLSTHYIVYVGWYDGVELVAENQSGIGVRYTSLQEALAGNTIKRFEKFGGTELQRMSVIPRINNLLGRAYDLVAFNCEHFARGVTTGKNESKQVKNASNIALIGGVTMLASNSPLIRNLGIAAIVIGIIGHASQ